MRFRAPLRCLSLEPVTVSPQPKLSPAAPKLPDIGIIEILLSQFGDVLGYLSQDSRGKFVVDADAEKALKLQKVLHTDSEQPLNKIYSLRLLDVSGIYSSYYEENVTF